MKLSKLVYTLFFLSVLNSSCDKEKDFLNAKPNASSAVPSTLRELELLMRNESVFCRRAGTFFAVAQSDEYYVTYSVWSNEGAMSRNTYIFAKDIYEGTPNAEWRQMYQQVFYANTVLDLLPKIGQGPGEQEQYNKVMGQALFFRAHAYYDLVQTYAMPYDPATAATALGIPLKKSPDFNEKVTRATVQECYDQITGDLTTALELLPATSPYKTSPSKVTVHAMLSRVFLALGNYEKALAHSDACLQQFNVLFDYNELNLGAFSVHNNGTHFFDETIFHRTSMFLGLLISRNRAIIDTNLYRSYEQEDLRKDAFFRVANGEYRHFGNYNLVESEKFCGIATDEIYLIRAECKARLNDKDGAMEDLNTLLLKRYRTGTFVPRTATDEEDALQQIITERRKELCFRGLRWTDLRRLNKDPRFATTLTRVLNGQTYTLSPNDKRYAMPIPDAEVQLMGLEQNQR